MAGVEKLVIMSMDKTCNLILVEDHVQQLVELISKSMDRNLQTFLVDFNSKIKNDFIVKLFARVNEFEFMSHLGTLEELKQKLYNLGYQNFNIIKKG